MFVKGGKKNTVDYTKSGSLYTRVGVGASRNVKVRGFEPPRAQNNRARRDVLGVKSGGKRKAKEPRELQKTWRKSMR